METREELDFLAMLEQQDHNEAAARIEEVTVPVADFNDAETI